MPISLALALAKRIACGDRIIIVPFQSAATHAQCKYGYDLFVISIPGKCICWYCLENSLLFAGSWFYSAVVGLF